MSMAPKYWPLAALPRRMSREMAAYYVGLSPSTFMQRVEAGQMPAPIRDGGRVLWDRVALDRVVDQATGLDSSAGTHSQSIDEARAQAEAEALAALEAQ